MATASSKDSKRINVYQKLQGALANLNRALKLAGAARADLEAVVKELEEAQGQVAAAGKQAEASVIEWTGERGEPHRVVRRDALPAPIRRRIARVGRLLEELVPDVKAVPVTRGQLALQKQERARRRDARRKPSEPPSQRA